MSRRTSWAGLFALILSSCTFEARTRPDSPANPPAGPGAAAPGGGRTVVRMNPGDPQQPQQPQQPQPARADYGVSPGCQPWVGPRMADLAQANALARGFQPASPVSCDELTSGSERTFTANLSGPGCHMVIGLSRDGTDLDLRVFDGGGQLVVEDVLTDNYPIVHFCGTGTFTVRSRMYDSSSHYAIQAFTGGPPPAQRPQAPQPGGVLHAGPVTPPPGQAGTCADWVPAQVQTLAMQSAQGMRPGSPLECGRLARDGEAREALGTAPGCHVVVGAGPAGADFDLFVYDQAGAQLASDEEVSNTATVRFCSQGPVTVRARMYQSEGPYGFQIFSP